MSKKTFFAKNEPITNIFARIAKSAAVAILYQWVSNTFDTYNIKVKFRKRYTNNEVRIC